jgi:hypothetical protein
MGFFDSSFDSNGNEVFKVHSHVWLFPVTAIPCTLLVMVVYQIWRRNREGRMASRRQLNPITDPEKAGEQ